MDWHEENEDSASSLSVAKRVLESTSYNKVLGEGSGEEIGRNFQEPKLLQWIKPEVIQFRGVFLMVVPQIIMTGILRILPRHTL